VALEDVEGSDWASPAELRQGPSVEAVGGHEVFGWVIPPVGPGSGGHLNIFRFVRHLESKGHECVLFVYDPLAVQTPAQTAQVLREHFEPMLASVHHDFGRLEECTAIFATGWTTAYPIQSRRPRAPIFYFVQDFEPSFYPVGTESVLAENTYRFGFHGITAGRWLARKLKAEFGMECDHYDFGSDFGRYHFDNPGPRRKVMFYARPVTPRRGFELGVLALDLFHKRRPEFELQLAGWPLTDWKLPFPFVDRGVLPLDRLNEFYNECSAALVLSFTNFSLLPLEILASGCIPVMNDGPNNRLVSDNPFIVYSRPTPKALAGALEELVVRPDLPDHARKASLSVEELAWSTAGDRLERIVLSALGR